MTSRVRTSLLSPLLVGAVLGVGLGAAGCGDQDAPAGTSPGVSSSPDPTPPPSSAPGLPTLTPPTAPPSTPSDSFSKVRLSGVVVADGTALVLTDANGVTWSLEGEVVADADLGSRTRVTVTGTAAKGSDPGPGEPVPLEVTDLSVVD